MNKRPTLVLEMSYRIGTWVHLRCILNAISTPFLEACGLSPAATVGCDKDFEDAIRGCLVNKKLGPA